MAFQGPFQYGYTGNYGGGGMDPVTAASLGIGAVSAISGFFEDDPVPVAGNLDPGSAFKAIMGTRAETAPLYQQLEALLRSQYGMADEGLRRQRGELSLAGRTAKQTLLDRERQSKADIQQQAARRGLSSVTQPLNLRGLGYQTSLGLSGIQESLGGMFAGLEANRLQQRLGITQQLGQVLGQRISQEQHFGDLFASTQGSGYNPFPIYEQQVRSKAPSIGALGKVFQALGSRFGSGRAFG